MKKYGGPQRLKKPCVSRNCLAVRTMCCSLAKMFKNSFFNSFQEHEFFSAAFGDI